METAFRKRLERNYMPRRSRYNFENIPTRHFWENDAVELVRVIAVSNRSRHGTTRLDFKGLKIARGGLLEQAIQAAPCPLHSSVVSVFVATITTLSEDPEGRGILSTPASALEFHQVHTLFRQIDEHFRKKGNSSAYAQAEVVRRFISYCRVPLANGHEIQHSGYSTELRLPPRPLKIGLSDKFDEAFPDIALALPASATGAGTPKEQDAHAKRHYEARLERLEEVCLKTLDEHERVVERIKEVKKAGLPKNLQQRTIKSLQNRGYCDNKILNRRSAGDRFRIAAFLVERHKFYQNSPHRNLLVAGIDELALLAPVDSHRLAFTVLLSDYYLSRTVIIACYLILLKATGWNNGTLLSLTRDRIIKTRSGYELIGLKRKTDQLQSAEVVERDDANDDSKFIANSAAVRAVQMLLAHDANVTEFATRKNTSVFVSMNASRGDNLEFDVIHRSHHIHQFCKLHNIPSFVSREIRNQVVQHRYLKSEKNIHVAQHLLGHKNAATTEEYLNNSIEYSLNEANIKCYMDVFANAVLFVTGRRSIPDEDQSSEALMTRALLWPPSRFAKANADYLVDQWLEAKGAMKLIIGIEEAQHCAYQHKYYLENMRSLLSANEAQFMKYELPRILICEVLYRLIQKSPLRKVLKDCEEVLNA